MRTDNLISPSVRKNEKNSIRKGNNKHWSEKSFFYSKKQWIPNNKQKNQLKSEFMRKQKRSLCGLSANEWQ